MCVCGRLLILCLKGPVTLGRINPKYIAVNNNILSGGEISSPAENTPHRNVFQQILPNTKAGINVAFKQYRKYVINNIELLRIQY